MSRMRQNYLISIGIYFPERQGIWEIMERMDEDRYGGVQGKKCMRNLRKHHRKSANRKVLSDRGLVSDSILYKKRTFLS